MVNSSVYEKVTYKQIDDMKHAIGFDNQKGLGTACFNRISNEKRRALVSRFR